MPRIGEKMKRNRRKIFDFLKVRAIVGLLFFVSVAPRCDLFAARYANFSVSARDPYDGELESLVNYRIISSNILFVTHSQDDKSKRRKKEKFGNSEIPTFYFSAGSNGWSGYKYGNRNSQNNIRMELKSPAQVVLDVAVRNKAFAKKNKKFTEELVELFESIDRLSNQELLDEIKPNSSLFGKLCDAIVLYIEELGKTASEGESYVIEANRVTKDCGASHRESIEAALGLVENIRGHFEKLKTNPLWIDSLKLLSGRPDNFETLLAPLVNKDDPLEQTLNRLKEQVQCYCHCFHAEAQLQTLVNAGMLSVENLKITSWKMPCCGCIKLPFFKDAEFKGFEAGLNVPQGGTYPYAFYFYSGRRFFPRYAFYTQSELFLPGFEVSAEGIKKRSTIAEQRNVTLMGGYMWWQKVKNFDGRLR